MGLSLLKKPSAFLPVLMSSASFFLVVGHVAIYPLVCETDEGTPAHIFQLLMGLQVPIVGYFAMRWLTTKPRQAAAILLLQAVAGIAAFAAVFIMEWKACHL
ncbi:MAG: hypothetical protein ABIV48_04270 [Pyrinomonadaceae bacterium]